MRCVLGKLELLRHSWVMDLTSGAVAVLAAITLVSALLLWNSLRLRRRQRLLSDTPRSKVRGVFIGLVELNGTAECENPCTSHLAGKACVHFQYTVDEHWSRTVVETYTDRDGKSRTRTRRESGWTTVAGGGEQRDFFLRDDTGALLVRPKGATLEPVELFDSTVGRDDPLYYGKAPSTAVAHSDHRRRFHEVGIPLHTPLYILGQARERDDIVAAQIQADRDAPLFLISTRNESRIQSGYAAWSWVSWLLGLLVAVVPLLLILRNRHGAPDPRWLSLTLAAGGVYLAAWAISWVWMVFNSLIALRNRVLQGASLIEVQLKRRHDLIPGIAAVVQGLGTHEREVQQALAALRSQTLATPVGQPGPDIGGVAAEIRTVIERYPDLVAQPAFAGLHETLVETEQRLELARNYYNDIATEYATRLQRMPDLLVARLARLHRQPLFTAAGFERASEPVQFA